jgi:predicted transcriptional regulator
MKHDQLVAINVQRMRRSLGVTEVKLARASGISRPEIEAIEAGGEATRSERHDIVAALVWLSNCRVANVQPHTRR